MRFILFSGNLIIKNLRNLDLPLLSYKLDKFLELVNKPLRKLSAVVDLPKST